MACADLSPGIAPLLQEYADLFTGNPLPGPILDVACGDGQNGIFLAGKGLSVICCDKSAENLKRARNLARGCGVIVATWLVDLETPCGDPLPEDAYGGIIVFRYLHRPLIPYIRTALRGGGVLVYETYTIEQQKYGKPHNPRFLLKPGELKEWFQDWEVIHHFEGTMESPLRAVAEIVCRKPPR